MDDLKVFKDVSKDLATIIKQLKEWKDVQEGIAKNTTTTVRAMKGGGTLGKGASGMLDNSLAAFSGFSAGQYRGIRNVLAQSMPTSRADIVTGAIGNAPKILGGFNSMMPDIGATFAQANSAFQGVVASGGRMSRADFEAYAQRGIGKYNATGVGSQVEAASYLAGRGMVMGSATFTQTLQTAGGLSMMMGMSNQAGAAAVEGLTSGAGSSNLLRNFGIYTSDPNTGKAKGTQDIVGQIKSRLTAGRGAFTTADVQESLRRGYLGVSLQNSGLSSDQQSMVVQSLMGDATDSKTGPINLDDQKSMDAATKAMGGNPNAPFMKIYGSQNAAMSRAESAYGTGADIAASGLEGLNAVAGELANTFGALNSAASTFMGNNAGSGVMGVLGGAANIATMGMMAKGMGAGGAGGPLGGMLGKMGPALGKAGKMLGKATPAIAAIGGGISMASDVANGQGWGTKQFSSDMGSTIGSVGGAVLGNLLLPGFGGIAGGMLGGLIGGGIGGLIGSGGDVSNPESTGVTASGGKSNQGVGNNGRLSLIPPVNGPLGDRFGATASYRTHPHRGQDWSVGEGTSVKACAAGKVIATNTSGELGRMVQVQHEGGWITQYCHLSNNNIKAVGDKVSQGEYIANTGNTGTATTGAHLHLALMKGGQYYDPMLYMNGASGAPATPDSSSADGASGGSAGGDSGVSGDSPNPIAQPGSNAVTASASGISGSASTIANQLGATGGGGEGLDKNPLLRKSSEDAYDQMTGRGGSKANVTINLTIGKATDMEARKFAQKVKEVLEDDRRLSSMGAN